MPIEPAKPKCKVCRRIKQQANRWFRIERVQKQGHIVGMRWSALELEDLLDEGSDFVCGPGCLAKETSDLAQRVIEGEQQPKAAVAHIPYGPRKTE